MPGISGAMLAINFGIYEKLLAAVINFFSDWKSNLVFLLKVGIGILLAITVGSRGIIFLLTYYKFFTMFFFVGLMVGGTYNFSKQISYHYKDIVLIILIIFIFLYLSFSKLYLNKLLLSDNLYYFVGGVIEIFSSVVPGISGTSLLMIMGIYDEILMMIANIYNYNYVISNINLYLSYGIGMIISFIFNCYLINYLIKKYRHTSYVTILGLSLASIIYLLIMIFKLTYTWIYLVIGIILFMLGIILASLLAK